MRLVNRESGLPYKSRRCLTGGIIALGTGVSVEGEGCGVVASGACEADVTSSGTDSC